MINRANQRADAAFGYPKITQIFRRFRLGKLQQQGDAWFVLTDVFYLSASEGSAPQLIKRGSEPQGPREPMIIPQAQVLFIENLRDDSEIVSAIRRFKSGQPVATPAPATPQPATATPTARPSTAAPSPSR